jgi:hypothetical protein
MKKISRRAFGGALTATGLAAMSTGAQQPPAEQAPGAKRDDRPGAKRDDPPPGAEALADFVIALYGKHLDGDRRKVVRGDAADMIKTGAALREVPLTNADEPDTAFRVETSGAPPVAGRRRAK